MQKKAERIARLNRFFLKTKSDENFTYKSFVKRKSGMYDNYCEFS